MCQTIGNILFTSKMQDMVLGDEYPWDDVLAFTMFARKATVHTTIQYTPAQLVSGCEFILNWHHDIGLEAVKKRIKKLINKGNTCKNWNHKNIHINKETMSYLKIHKKQNSIKTHSWVPKSSQLSEKLVLLGPIE